MHPLKIWQLSVLILSAYFYGFTTSVEIEPCFPAVKNQPCNMTCRVQDLTQAVDFNCNGTSRAACFQGVYCSPSIEIEGGNTLYFEISSLSYASDICDWTCTYGASSSSVSNPTIFSGFSSPLILTNQTEEDKINLTATAECVYPYNTTVQVQYREEQDASEQYQSLTQQVDVQTFHVPGNCGFDIEKRIVATYEVSRKHSLLGGKRVYLRMKFSQFLSATPNYTNEFGPFTFDKSPDSEGFTTPSSTLSSDISTTVLEPSPTISSDMSTTVSEVPPPPVTTSSAGLSKEMVITIISSSSVLGAGGLILLIVLVVRHCRPKHKEIAAKNERNHFANKQGNLTKKNDFKSFKPTKSQLSKKRNTKQGSMDKKKDSQLGIKIACKDRIFQHYPQTTDYLNNYGNQHVFNHSHTEGSISFYGNQHNNYPRPHSRPNNRMLYQSHYPEHPGHNEGMFQDYRADNLYRGQNMYQRPYVALYDMNYINDKQNDKRSFKGRQYEKNWDLLY